MEQEKTKRPVGRPKNTTTKQYSLKLDLDLVDLVQKQTNRNRFINECIRAFKKT